ncbi:MAG: fumarate hydratase [Phycisphaerales bacterium]|jgi:fumarate hydratase subunit alpha
MRYIEFEKVVDTVKSLCIEAAHELPEDVLEALKEAKKKESEPTAIRTLETLIENARIAAAEKIPLCQDTGITVVFVEQGADVAIKPPVQKPQAQATIYDAINTGVEAGYKDGYLRKSVVAEPLNERKNTGTNCPAIIHHSIVPSDKIQLTVMTKGGGCENKSLFKMFVPTAKAEQVIDWIVEVVKSAGPDACPPFVVGVGMGGNFERSCLLSKKALLRKIGQRHPENFYAKFEQDLLARINALGIGPGGFGGKTTALDCLVEYAPCHIASLPVAVNIECHSHRHKSVVL